MTYWRTALVYKAGLVPILIAGAGGCTNLEFLDANQCGNLVVEIDRGEDCDGSATCGSPGSTHECRYLCDTTDRTCPETLGYHCGADGVCRRPQGTFLPGATNTTVTAQNLLVGDINADGCAEVVISAQRTTAVYAFSSPYSTSCVESRQTLHVSRPDSGSIALPVPALADMDLDESTNYLSLLSSARSLYGDGLSMHFTNGSSTLSPILFPRFQRPGAAVRPIAASMRKSGVVVLFEDSKDGVATDVTLIFDSQQAPVTFPKAYMGHVSDIAAIVAADVDPMINAMDDVLCDEIIVAKRGDTKLELYKLCTGASTNGFEKLLNSQIALTNAKVRDSGSRLFAADANEDGITDLLTNLSDNKVHIAYGLGNGRFHSIPPEPMPPPMTDQKANSINDGMADAALAADGILVTLEFDPKHPGIDYYAPPCPPLDTFSSPNCAPVAGGCEAVVADIDADGDQDVVVSEGQGVDLIIHRQTQGSFHVSFVETACPPHSIGTGDFDGDGVNDIAYFDQTSKAAYENTTSLSIVYGNAFAAPNTPVTSGRFDEANGLSVVHFGPPGTSSQIAITRAVGPTQARASAVGVVEIGAERSVVAPYYMTSDVMGAQATDTLTLLGQTPGNFGSNAAPALAVVTQSSNNTRELWIVDSNQDGGSLRAQPKSESTDIPCANGCVLAAMSQKDTTDNLLVLGDTSGVVYRVGTLGFVEEQTFALKHAFQQTVANANPDKYFPRPLVADVDHDSYVDVLALANTGAFVGFFGSADGSLSEVELIPAPSCWDSQTGWAKAGCGNYVAAQIDADADGQLDLVLGGSELPNVDKAISLAAYKLENRALVVLDGISIGAEALRPDTDFLALGARDMDADGVRDLIFMPNSNYFMVLRGLPEHE